MLLIYLQPCNINNAVYKAAGKLLKSNAENFLFVAGFLAWFVLYTFVCAIV